MGPLKQTGSHLLKCFAAGNGALEAAHRLVLHIHWAQALAAHYALRVSVAPKVFFYITVLKIIIRVVICLTTFTWTDRDETVRCDHIHIRLSNVNKTTVLNYFNSSSCDETMVFIKQWQNWIYVCVADSYIGEKLWILTNNMTMELDQGPGLTLTFIVSDTPSPPGKNQSACWMIGSMMPTIWRDKVVIISVMLLKHNKGGTA